MENGDVFETTQNLSKHNKPGQVRFVLLEEETKPTQKLEVTPTPSAVTPVIPEPKKPQDDGLDTMTLAELRAFASDAKIDVLGVNRKDEMIAVIRRAVSNS